MSAGAVTPELLEEHGLFRFTSSARGELASFFDNPRVAGTAGQLVIELVHLTAAEFALAGPMPDSRPVLPVAEPFAVDVFEARMALLKADCAVITLHSIKLQERPLTLADITAFSGDVAKLEHVGLSFYEPPQQIGDIARAVDELERLHRDDPSDVAQAFGLSGILRLQGFLWAVKLSLPRQDPGQAIADAYEAFELAEPVGGATVELEPVGAR